MEYQQKHSDVADELEEGTSTVTANSQPSPDNCKGTELTTPSNKDSIYPSHMSDRDSGESFTGIPYNISSSSFLNEPVDLSGNESKSVLIITEGSNNT